MSELPYVAMNEYNEKGMTGDCRSLAKTAAIAIGTAINPAVGGLVAAAAFSYFEDDIFGPKGDPRMQPKGPSYSPGGLLGVSNGMTKATAFQAAMLQKWFYDKFQPWQKSYFTDLSNLSDEEFKNDINDKLLNLEAIRLMYKTEGVKQGKITGMGAPSAEDIYSDDSTDYDIPKLSDIETKMDAFKYLSDMIRDIFLETMAEKGKEPGNGFKMKTVKNFTPESYENLDAPEDIDYQGGSKTDVDIYVFSDNDNGGVDIDNPGNSLGDDNGIGDIRVADSAQIPERLFVDKKKQGSFFTSLPLIIAGSFLGKYAYNTLTKNEKQNSSSNDK